MTDTQPPGDRRFRLTLTHQIFLGLVIGCLIGWLFPAFAVSLGWISQLFLRLIRMVLAPLLITTLVAGIAGAGSKMVGRLAVKAIVWFVLATTVALFIGVAAANLVKPGVGVPAEVARAVEPAAAPANPSGAAVVPATASSTDRAATATPKPASPPGKDQLAKPKTPSEFVLEIVPTSIFDAMARNNILPIVVFSLFFGLAVAAAGRKARLIHDLADAGAEVMFKVVGFVMYFAPFGVCAAIAVTLGNSGVAVLVPLLKCIGALYASLLVFFALLFTATRLLTRAHMPTFLRAIREPAVIAFTTSSSEAAMPRAMQVLEQLGIPRRVVGFVVPTGYAFNLDGSTLYLSLALMFVAQAGGVDMTWNEQITAMLILMLASKGLAGVPRAALVVLAAMVADLHLPDYGVAILLGIDAIMDMGRTCVNVVGNCVATVIVGVWEKAIPADAPVFTGRATPGTDSPLPIAEVVRETIKGDRDSA